MIRNIIFGMCLLGLFVAPAVGQLRSDVPTSETSVRVYDHGSSFSLGKLFDAQHFKMQHSYQASFNSFGGGQGSLLGEFTTAAMWQFSNKLAARVEVAFQHNPLGGLQSSSPYGQVAGSNQYGQVYLKNVELAWKPFENTTFHVSFRQNTAQDYYNQGYRGNSFYGGGFHNQPSASTLFWNPSLR